MKEQLNEEDVWDNIQRYIHNEMDTEEVMDFETKMQNDKKLNDEVVMGQQLKKVFEIEDEWEHFQKLQRRKR